MLDLLADDDRRGFGIRTALAVEGVPYRELGRGGEGNARLRVLCRDASVPAGVPSLLIGGPFTAARSIFAIGAGRDAVGPVSMPLDGAIWPGWVRALAQGLGVHELRLPRVSVFVPDVTPRGDVLATVTLADGRQQPAIVQQGTSLWCLLDAGSALCDLLDESYAVPVAASRAQRFLRPALVAYYRAPEWIRARVRRRTYALLDRQLHRGRAQASDYPVDLAGWLLLELCKSLIRRGGGGLVRIARWPDPFTAAAVLTHDLEPTSYAYTRGAERLLARVAAAGHPATFGLVAEEARRYLEPSVVREMLQHEVLCHGLAHNGETLRGSREDVARRLDEGRRRLEERLGSPVVGFRSPRLDRSSALLWALDRSGFCYDSSYPDVDRENMGHYGAGVRLNVPFRPPIEDRGGVRPSRCLELPLSAPDCIQPLFQGEDLRGLRRAVRAKVDFVCATGGLLVGLVHGGVFGARDAARRGAHLAFVRRQVGRPGVWLASARQVADWWQMRERLEVEVGKGELRVTNRNPIATPQARVLVDHQDGEHVCRVPSLAPGATASLAIGPGQAKASVAGAA